MNGSSPVPAVELNGSASATASVLDVNGVPSLLALNGSSECVCETPENGSDATVLMTWAENRSGSAEPVLERNGSEEAKGSAEEKLLEEDWLKKAVANGSVPLKGSPPNGSG